MRRLSAFLAVMASVACSDPAPHRRLSDEDDSATRATATATATATAPSSVDAKLEDAQKKTEAFEEKLRTLESSSAMSEDEKRRRLQENRLKALEEAKSFLRSSAYPRPPGCKCANNDPLCVCP